MSTPFASLYTPLRAILGDRAVNTVWNYDGPTLDSALRAVMLTGRGPQGYTLDGDPWTSSTLAQDLQVGDDAALLLFDAALVLVAGEDGALSYTTRSLSVRDGGERKSALLWDLQNRIHEIRNGASVFATFQSFMQYLVSMGSDGNILEHSARLGGIEVTPVLGDIVF